MFFHSKIIYNQKTIWYNQNSDFKEVKILNQILSVDNSKKEKVKRNNMRTRGPIEIHSILKFFAISILIFGVFMIGSGSYPMYKESSKAASNKKPVIDVQQTSETELLLKVTHDKALSELIYSWNDEEPTQVSCNGKKEIETKIEIPAGRNNLRVYATDANGQNSEYTKEYSVEEDINVRVEKEKNNIRITANGKNQLQYMTHRWDEGEETRVEINSDHIEEVIEAPKGLHILTVIVVDINNTTQTVEQEVEGVTKPKLEVTTDGSNNFVIKTSDEYGITRIEFIKNETEKNYLDLTRAFESVEDRKEYQYSYPLSDGENKLEITVYNEKGASETARVFVNK